MIYVFLLFVVCVGGCYWLFTSVFDLFVPKQRETYVDKSVHYHTHNHSHEHKNISIIDEQTKKAVFELKESKEVGK